MILKLPPFSERLIYYLLVPDLFSRVVLEAGMGMYWYTNVQPKLWVFYGFMAIEYAYFFTQIGKMRLARGTSLLSIYLAMILVIHGAVVGFLWGNSSSKIITDTIVIFVFALNIIILNTDRAFSGFDFDRVLYFMKIYAFTMVVVGLVAVGLGKPSIVNLGGAGGGPLCLTILVLGLAESRRVSFGGLGFVLFILLMIAPNMTRTILAVFAIMVAFYVGPKIVRSAVALYVLSVVLVATPFVIPFVIPEDSPVMHRIRSLTEDSGDEEGGSLGERREEFRAVNEKLHELGPQAEWFGYGAGGVYQPVLTNGQIPAGYSHAHYGWALFKLRYGYVGYFYLVTFGALLLSNCVRLARRKDPTGRLVFLLAIWGVFFIFTYFSFNFLIAGLQFCRPPLPNKASGRSHPRPQEVARRVGLMPEARPFRRTL